jgi:hypothetical protein
MADLQVILILQRSADDIRVIHAYHQNRSSLNKPTVYLHGNNVDRIDFYSIYIYHHIEHSSHII